MPNKNIQQKEDSGTSCTVVRPDLTNLEKLMHIPVLPVNSGFPGTNRRGVEKLVNSMTAGKPFGLLITTQTQQNFIIKTWGMLFSSLQIKRLKKNLSAIAVPVLGCYGIYPYIQQPVAIYQLGTQAENYVNENILPPNTGGISGLLRRIIMFITSYHLSTAGVVLVLRKDG